MRASQWRRPRASRTARWPGATAWAGAAGVRRVRTTLRPARDVGDFLERLEEISREDGFNRFGFPKLVPGAKVIRDFGAEAHATKPPLPVQNAFSRTVLAIANLRSREYKFVDEWDVAAPP